jgi:hypothetical protein
MGKSAKIRVIRVPIIPYLKQQRRVPSQMVLGEN